MTGIIFKSVTAAFAVAVLSGVVSQPASALFGTLGDAVGKVVVKKPSRQTTPPPAQGLPPAAAPRPSREQVIVRDHRSGVIVRDHRGGVIVRDHR